VFDAVVLCGVVLDRVAHMFLFVQELVAGTAPGFT
jgi:hypothetical protein